MGMSSDGGGERKNDNNSDNETHTKDDRSQNDDSTGLSTGGFEVLDRKIAYNHPLEESELEAMETSDKERSNNGDGKNNNNNVRESSDDES